MIAYEELSAALERWRVKNGLPGTPPLFAEGSTMKRQAAVAAPAPSYSAPSYSAPSYGAPSYGSGPSYAAPAAAPMPAPAPAPAPAPRVPSPPSAATLDEELDEFAEDDVLDEAVLDNDGPDFAVAFSGPPPVSPGALSAEDERESTLIGSTDPSMVPPPAGHDWDRSPPRSVASVVDDDDADEYNAADKTPT